MDRNVISHVARVVGSHANFITVSYDPAADAHDCTGCALSTVCRPGSGREVTFEIPMPTGLDAESLVGRSVEISAQENARRRATFGLLVLPLVVFLVLAVFGHVFKLDPGLSALIALSGSFLSYLVVNRLLQKRQKIWKMVKIVD